MKFINKFNTKEDFETVKPQLNELEHNVNNHLKTSVYLIKAP